MEENKTITKEADIYILKVWKAIFIEISNNNNEKVKFQFC